MAPTGKAEKLKNAEIAKLTSKVQFDFAVYTARAAQRAQEADSSIEIEDMARVVNDGADANDDGKITLDEMGDFLFETREGEMLLYSGAKSPRTAKTEAAAMQKNMQTLLSKTSRDHVVMEYSRAQTYTA